MATRALDWTSTEECLRRPWQQSHEGELPTILVKNKTVFDAAANIFWNWSSLCLPVARSSYS
jgi:hypothetical protein